MCLITSVSYVHLRPIHCQLLLGACQTNTHNSEMHVCMLTTLPNPNISHKAVCWKSETQILLKKLGWRQGHEMFRSNKHSGHSVYITAPQGEIYTPIN